MSRKRVGGLAFTAAFGLFCTALALTLVIAVCVAVGLLSFDPSGTCSATSRRLRDASPRAKAGSVSPSSTAGYGSAMKRSRDSAGSRRPTRRESRPG